MDLLPNNIHLVDDVATATPEYAWDADTGACTDGLGTAEDECGGYMFDTDADGDIDEDDATWNTLLLQELQLEKLNHLQLLPRFRVTMLQA